jgi:hypothetical protein
VATQSASRQNIFFKRMCGGSTYMCFGNPIIMLGIVWDLSNEKKENIRT